MPRAQAQGLHATSTCLSVRSDVLVPCKALPNKVYASVPLMQLLATACPGGRAILKVLYGMYIPFQSMPSLAGTLTSLVLRAALASLMPADADCLATMPQ